jgi:hypothetical protein
MKFLLMMVKKYLQQESFLIGKTVLLRLQQTARCFSIWQNGTYNSGVHMYAAVFLFFILIILIILIK